MSRTFAIRICVVVVLVQLSSLAHSFFIVKVPFGSPFSHTHQAITEDVLTNIFVTKEQVQSFALLPVDRLEFSDSAINLIIRRNYTSDSHSLYIPSWHFDNGFTKSAFDAAFDRLKIRRQAIMAALRQAEINHDIVWTQLGRSLHSIQDFYAHSTWVDQERFQIIDFGQYAKADQRPTELNADLNGEDFCSDNANVILGAGKPITSGWFKDDVSLPDPPAVTEMKCAHGTKTATVKHCFGGPKTGINKDVDCSLMPFGEQLLRKAALLLAKKESRAFIQGIIDELIENENIDGLCALMGETACPGDFNLYQLYWRLDFPYPVQVTRTNTTDGVTTGNVGENTYAVIPGRLFCRTSSGGWVPQKTSIPKSRDIVPTPPLTGPHTIVTEETMTLTADGTYTYTFKSTDKSNQKRVWESPPQTKTWVTNQHYTTINRANFTNGGGGYSYIYRSKGKVTTDREEPLEDSESNSTHAETQIGQWSPTGRFSLGTLSFVGSFSANDVLPQECLVQ